MITISGSLPHLCAVQKRHRWSNFCEHKVSFLVTCHTIIFLPLNKSNCNMYPLFVTIYRLSPPAIKLLPWLSNRYWTMLHELFYYNTWALLILPILHTDYIFIILPATTCHLLSFSNDFPLLLKIKHNSITFLFLEWLRYVQQISNHVWKYNLHVYQENRLIYNKPWHYLSNK